MHFVAIFYIYILSKTRGLVGGKGTNLRKCRGERRGEGRRVYNGGREAKGGEK